jgi:hypothetical protein
MGTVMTGLGLRVLFDEQEIVLSAQARRIARIAWADIARVVVRTTDDGPYFPDVYWEIYRDEGEPAVMFPQGISGTDELLRELQRRLPGFANDRLIQAMSSTSNELFVLWPDG